MNNERPKTIGEAKVILYSPIDQRHEHTGKCIHEMAGKVMFLHYTLTNVLIRPPSSNTNGDYQKLSPNVWAK